jgi:hypothetical protein
VQLVLVAFVIGQCGIIHIHHHVIAQEADAIASGSLTISSFLDASDKGGEN